MVGGTVVDPASRLGVWASYFSVPGTLPAEWKNDARLATKELRGLDEYTQQLVGRYADSPRGGCRPTPGRLGHATKVST